MSRRMSVVFAFLGSFWMTSLMGGQAPVPPALPQHVATISFSAAVMQTNEARRDFGALQIKFAPRQKQIESLGKELDDLRKQFNELKDRWSDSELNARSQALAAKQKQMDHAEDDYRDDSQSEGEQAFRRIAQKVFDFLQTYAHDRGYTVVVDRGTQDIPVVLYTTQEADITGAVVTAYNAKAGIPSPPETTGGRAPGASSLDAPHR